MYNTSIYIVIFPLIIIDNGIRDQGLELITKYIQTMDRIDSIYIASNLLNLLLESDHGSLTNEKGLELSSKPRK